MYYTLSWRPTPPPFGGLVNRLSTYYWNGVMNNWHTPANTGRYKVCQLPIHIWQQPDLLDLPVFTVFRCVERHLHSLVGVNNEDTFLSSSSSTTVTVTNLARHNDRVQYNSGCFVR